MIELFSYYMNITKLKASFPEKIKYKQLEGMRRDLWSEYGPKQGETKPFILLSKIIQYNEFWYRAIVRFKRVDSQSPYPPLIGTYYKADGLVPYAIFKLEQKGSRFETLETYRSTEDSKVTDYLKDGVPKSILEAIITNLNYNLSEKGV